MPKIIGDDVLSMNVAVLASINSSKFSHDEIAALIRALTQAPALNLAKPPAAAEGVPTPAQATTAEKPTPIPAAIKPVAKKK